MIYNESGVFKIAVIDSGLKFNQIRILCRAGACVHVLPWNSELNIYGNIKKKQLFIIFIN